jgi:ATP-binding cassette, subfamily C (CFTR/MRP), member 1
LDDALSAVDAHTGKALVDNCLLTGPMSKKTRILATHSLSVLSKVDYIYVLEQGAIVEEGTYTVRTTTNWLSCFRYSNCSRQDLRAKGQTFSKLMEEYGSIERHEKIQGKEGGAKNPATVDTAAEDDKKAK